MGLGEVNETSLLAHQQQSEISKSLALKMFWGLEQPIVKIHPALETDMEKGLCQGFILINTLGVIFRMNGRTMNWRTLSFTWTARKCQCLQLMGMYQ